MSTALVIAGRELRDKTRIFITALILALVPFAVTLVPASKGWGRPTIVALVGGMLSLAMALGLAIALGASTIGRELSDRRLSFYFSKPVSPAAIWIGKAAASILTALACFAIISTPALIFSSDTWNATWTMTRKELLLSIAVAVIVLFLVSHALSTMIRSRSALLGIDVLLLAATVVALLLLARPLVLGGAAQLLKIFVLVMTGVLTLILAIVPIVQLAQGRTDIRRNHLALSRVLWPAVAAVLLLAGGFIAWVVLVGPSDMEELHHTSSSGGRWFFAAGRAANRGDYHASFLVSGETGKWQRLPSPPWWSSVFSRDGRTLAWLATKNTPPSLARKLELLVWRPDTEARPRETNLHVGQQILLTDDGSRLATITTGGIAVHDLQRDALLASARGLNPDAAHVAMFVRPDLIRIWEHQSPAHAVLIYELDVARKTLTKTGQAEADTTYHSLSANADGSRVLLSKEGIVIDGRTGATLYRVPVSPKPRRSTMLSDGTVVVPDHTTRRIRIYGPDGRQTADVAVPGNPFSLVSAELAGGKIAVTTIRPRQKGYSMLVLDVKRGVIERETEGLSGPIVPWYVLDPRIPLLERDVPVVTYGGGAQLVLWDWTTGKQRGVV